MHRPPTVVCYICHREYGTSSIGIHERACLKKWHEQNDKLPSSQRQPEPVKPQGFPAEPSNPNQLTGASDQNANLEAYNAAALKTSTASCRRCGRHFEASRLSMHEAHCKPTPRHSRFHEYEARRPDVDLELLHKPLSGKYFQPSPTLQAHDTGLVPCRVCGRSFAPDRIKRHQETCKATPLKLLSKAKDSKTRQRNPPPPGKNNEPAQTASCFTCGKSLSPGAKFCDQCGTPLQTVDRIP